MLRTGPQVILSQFYQVRLGLALVITRGRVLPRNVGVKIDIRMRHHSDHLAPQLCPVPYFRGAGRTRTWWKGGTREERISLSSSAVLLANAIPAGAIDGGIHLATSAIVTLSGITATLLLAPLPDKWRLFALIFAAVP